MYGFHKKVGLSDNSMRASEKKAKSPSEYSNPFFRRGHPELLWLIQKPRNAGPNSKGKGPKRTDLDQNEDENDDYIEEIQQAQQQPQSSKTKLQGRLAIGQGDASLPSEQLVGVHRELQAIRQQQSQIAAMIHRLKREHEQLYGQAANFQDQHSRHENSINAILTFLATVYNRSLQGHEGVQGIANLFTSAIPQDTNQSHVVDVGDYTFDQLNGADGAIQRSFKRQPLLLKAPPAEDGPVSTASPPSSNHSPYVEEVFGMRNQQRQTQRASQPSHPTQDDILSVIQNTNARNSTPGTPAPDFSNVLSSLENSGGGSPLTTTQRADMLRLISNQASAPDAGANALTSPNPPHISNNYDRSLADTKSDLENLAKMQADQDRSVQNLTNLLQPLSPTGSIPGLSDGADVQPPPLDIDDFLNSSANYFTDFPPDQNLDAGVDAHNDIANTNEINFADLGDGDDELFGNLESNDGTNQGPLQNGNNGNDYLNVDGTGDDEGGNVESMASSEVTSPANTTATADGDGPSTRSRVNAAAEQQSGNSPARKRKRMG